MPRGCFPGCSLPRAGSAPPNEGTATRTRVPGPHSLRTTRTHVQGRCGQCGKAGGTTVWSRVLLQVESCPHRAPLSESPLSALHEPRNPLEAVFTDSCEFPCLGKGSVALCPHAVAPTASCSAPRSVRAQLPYQHRDPSAHPALGRFPPLNPPAKIHPFSSLS